MKKAKHKLPTQFLMYGELDYNYELSLSREFSDADAIAKILLYKINIVQTKTHSLYGESKFKDKKFLKPVELNVSLTIGDIKQNYLMPNGLYDETVDSFSFGVYLEELDEKNIAFTIGDYIKYYDGDKDRYYEVSRVSQIKHAKSMLGYKPTFTKIDCVYVRDKNLELN